MSSFKVQGARRTSIQSLGGYLDFFLFYMFIKAFIVIKHTKLVCQNLLGYSF
jgi:hypothetical protein